MSNNLKIILSFVISWGWSISLGIFNIIVFIQFLDHDVSLIGISGILNIIDIILFSKGKGLSIILPIFLGALIAIKDFWTALCLSLIIENIFSFIFGTGIMIYGFIASKN